MGCGSSTAKEQRVADATPADKRPEVHPNANEKKTEQNVKEDSKKDQQTESKSNQPSTLEKGEGISEEDDWDVVRDRSCGEVKINLGSRALYLYSPIPGGISFACYKTKAKEVYSTEITQDRLTEMKKNLGDFEWPTFWKLLATAMAKNQVSFSESTLEVKFKSKGMDPVTWKIELTKDESKTASQKFLRQYPKIKAGHQAAAKEADKKDSKGKETDYNKKDALFAVSEGIIEAAEESNRILNILPELRSQATLARRACGKVEGEIKILTQELDRRNGIDPSHPLDSMYDQSTLPPTKPEHAVNLEESSWNTSAFETEATLADVAVALFHHHGLVEKFNMDSDVLRNYWNAVQATETEAKFHNHVQSIQMLFCAHQMLQALKGPLQLAPEDIFTMIFTCGVYNLGNEGVSDTFTKRAGSMLSMLYSDLYAVAQNVSTAAFELMCNPKLNILESLSADGARDVTEAVRECLVIKANVQMVQYAERLSDFLHIKSSDTERSSKDNVRIILTHAVRLCHYSALTQPDDLQRKWTRLMADEFYKQGELEIALGLSPSLFIEGSTWSTDPSRHEYEFANGMITVIDSIVMPIAKEFATMAPELQFIVDQTTANRENWEADGGSDAAQVKAALQSMGKVVSFTDNENAIVCARPGPDLASIWIMAVDKEGNGYHMKYDDACLAKKEIKLKQLILDFESNPTVSATISQNSCSITVENNALELPRADDSDIDGIIVRGMHSSLDLRQTEKANLEKKISDIKAKAESCGNKSITTYSEESALHACIACCKAKEQELKVQLAKLQDQVKAAGGRVDGDKIQIEDALAIKVRNPLKAPLPPGVLTPPDCKDVDKELLKVLKSRYLSPEGGATEECTPDQKYCNVIQPYLSSEFAKVTSTINNDKRQLIYDCISKLDDWDFDVFELQRAMSGGISGECLREQPHGGALFITMYALCFKWQFMQKFNIDEQVLINWLSVVEAGYHPNPYHNSMHAADVLHVTHYIIDAGGCKAKIKASDQEVFAALFAAAIHDYNHPGINNAFHTKSQNYLAVLFNDRSVNENIHASSVFELMRIDEFNILKAFDGETYVRMREDIVEFVLGTDMGLHSMFVARFKKRIELVDSKMYKTKQDRNLAVTMAIKMADISNCGRPKKLYHAWCNVIVDEFYQQGDRERLHGMAVSPFMDRFTSVVSKGQIGFMNYIVMPLFECMGEFLDHMQMATGIVDENKGFWQEHEDW
eukprot:TRINITY_DN12791_c0_g1_i1.p1 TRINITY_DN12791_c0_g1~~TRINITY_DN12791_c0_g1_i1.p1  ORF type:complete len:1226 (+),score=256.11 TRINITY_DN12791_c0_g1_i1:87-3764(+)